MKIVKPKITVIMPYFRKKVFFKKSINSVLSQTFKSYEVIIIFDDNNLEELDYIKNIIKNKKKIRLIINKNNVGAGYSRNVGIDNSKSPYIAFLDCDDVWHENKLKFQYEFMIKNNYKLMQYINNNPYVSYYEYTISGSLTPFYEDKTVSLVENVKLGVVPFEANRLKVFVVVFLTT